MANDYNSTMNLPKTDFSMRASLPQKEPGMVEAWDKNDLYYKMVEHNEGKPTFILHDGPPYANASIHLGTALNKVLKDIIIRSKNMSGYCAPYIPGWDTHGLPIELKALAEMGVGKDNTVNITPVELRRTCRDFAKKHVEIQKGQFKRLGTLADYKNPYITLTNDFEAKQIEVFGAMANKGYIYKGLKPVAWCPDCQTALAEAEIEYANDPCTTVYVKFNVTDDKGVLTALGADLAKTYVVIWTTTVWTLPANLALCVGPRYEYVLVKANDEFYVIAEELLSSTMGAAGITEYEIVGRVKGADLEYIVCKHPFIDRDSLVICGDHVTLESGTGIVHTAPGHGLEDFEVCVNNYPEIPIVVPVDNKGYMTADAGMFEGMSTDEANKAILEHMKNTGSLFASEDIVHQYPHCWRCKNPILFRATEQWFCSVDKFKDEAVEAIRAVHWIPDWGEDRIIGMVKDRSDWCISRQRTWGVPIPIFFCKDCGKEYVTEESIKAVSELFAKEGSDSWYIKDASEILPEGTVCPHCGCKHFEKETDIMDVWFDSGVTHASVLENTTRPTWKNHSWPSDLYLEGADQYRGWFQSSLLTAVALRGEAPYRQVLTHGWTVDGEGKAMHKSLGNGVAPEEIIEKYGADVLRLWAASADYRQDMRCSDAIFKQLSDTYLKIRNTSRYILGNLAGFDPNNCVPFAELCEMDKWALSRLNTLLKRCIEAYDKYEFYTVVHSVHNFCVVDMSNFYLDVIKDRLYCDGVDSASRRGAQTVIYKILDTLVRILCPILAFTSDEIWKAMPHEDGARLENAMLNDMPKVDEAILDAALEQKWERVQALRDRVNRSLEEARAAKEIGKSLEAKVTISANGEEYRS